MHLHHFLCHLPTITSSEPNTTRYIDLGLQFQPPTIPAQQPRTTPRMTKASAEPDWCTIAGLPMTATIADLEALNASLHTENEQLDARLEKVRASLAIYEQWCEKELRFEAVHAKVKNLEEELERQDAEEGCCDGGYLREITRREQSLRLIGEWSKVEKAKELEERQQMEKLEAELARQDALEGRCDGGFLREIRREKAKQKLLAEWYVLRHPVKVTEKHALIQADEDWVAGDRQADSVLSSPVPRSRRQESRLTEF